jgi:hypothetical protein
MFPVLTKPLKRPQIKIKGSLDTALAVAELLSHERSQLYGTTETPAAVPSTGADYSSSVSEGYSDGSPAPITTDIIKSRL